MAAAKGAHAKLAEDMRTTHAAEQAHPKPETPLPGTRDRNRATHAAQQV